MDGSDWMFTHKSVELDSLNLFFGFITDHLIRACDETKRYGLCVMPNHTSISPLLPFLLMLSAHQLQTKRLMITRAILDTIINIFTYLCELHIQFTDGGIAMSFNKLHGTWVLRRVSSEVTINDSLNTRVAKGKNPVSRRKDDDSNLGATKSGKLASLFEKPGPAFWKGNLEIAFLRHFHHLHLLATSTLSRHG